jgi:hypothetical protein
MGAYHLVMGLILIFGQIDFTLSGYRVELAIPAASRA